MRYMLIGLIQVFLLVITITHSYGRDNVRHSILAGSWYPGTRDSLHTSVDSYLKQATPHVPEGRIYALICPHAGYQYSGKAAAYGYKLLQGKDIKRVVVIAPSHHMPFRGLSVLDVEAYETPLGEVLVDQDAGAKLREHPMIDSIPSAHSREHSLEIQLPFLQETLGSFKLVPIVVGQLRGDDYQNLADAIRPIIDESTLVVVSSDFTHFGPSFGYVPFRSDIKQNLSKLDGDAIENIVQKNFEGFRAYLAKTDATICGREGISLLLKLLPENATGEKLVYYTSGDVTGDFSTSVSYASIVFTVPVSQQKGTPAGQQAAQ